MKFIWGAWGSGALITCCLLLAAGPVSAQNKLPANSVQATRAVLVQKALVLEARGRPDMALQLWQQVLLSEPNNAQALAGVARDYKLMGSAEKANQALSRLRAVNPKDPNIARIEALSSTQTQSEQLKQAGALAAQGKADDAMRIYRQLYGDRPPNGEIALAYYETLYGTATGKQAALAGMRDLVQHNPGEARYAIALGTMLTFDARTRAEGIRILQEHPQDPDAQDALRKALIWNAPNPASADELRRYLKAHPGDTELAHHLATDEAQLARMRSGIARTPEEMAAFNALNAGHLDVAEQRFSALLEKDPDNGRLLAGMGFLRMRQRNFGAAISYLNQAETNGFKAKIVQDALDNSRFWNTMGEATQAFDQNQLDVAHAQYRAALTMRPKSPEALVGLAGLLVKEQHYDLAAGVYEQLIRVQPNSADGWRGLFLAYARGHQDEKALATMMRFPAAAKAAMAKDPDYLRTLASIYQDEGRNSDAQRVLAQALSLPFPNHGATLETDTKLQYAGILLEAKHYDQAVGLYLQVLNHDPGNLAAWEGLVTAHHNLSQDTQAVNDVERMPAATYESALADPSFLSMLGAIYQQANQFEIAQGFLERAERLEIASGGHASVDLELQIAAIDLLRNDPDRAYPIYRDILAANPGDAKAWQGLITALQATNRNTEALQQLAQIPGDVRKKLEANIAFVQMEASLYAATADTARAIQYMNRVVNYYARLKQQPPADIDVQNAWLLYNTGNDRALYPNLMRLGGRTDLTVAQREMVENIWASWSVRRATAAMEDGNLRRAVDILDAAKLAFPNNLAVRKAVAGGYARLGRGREALSIFKTVPMQDATAGDFQGAVGAALAANDKSQAEIWLRQALERYPRDPAILTLAAQYEQARGDNERAADYYRASLAAMPKISPVDRLAHVLVYPDQDTRPHKAITAADLQRLLNPDDEPFQKTTKLPPLPAYGADPYNGMAPVILNEPTAPSQGSAPMLNHPASDVRPLNAPGQSPVIVPIPNGAELSVPHPSRGFLREGWETTEAHAPCKQNLLHVDWIEPQPVSSGGTGAGQLGAQSVTQPRLPVAVPNVPISANPQHSLASDTWKGLVFSLMAGGRNAEALDELNKIPADVRMQLEADVEFVQGMAGLYFSVGDIVHATAYLNRVESYYLVHRGNAPAGLETQHAWLLYNLKDDVALYPVLIRLDERGDLSAAQRLDIQNLWASWAVRRAADAIDRGNLLRGVELLQAASEDYPDNMSIRRAVAGAYARVGRATDALALYKAIPMGDAAAGDYQGAVSAAMAAGDMAQAETWLRQALARYPNDPQVLGLAARFEQARGNNERASAFWRAALAAMPPGTAIKPLQSGLAFPPGSYRAPSPGDSKKLLDPRLDPVPTPETMAPLPSYQPQTTAPAPSTQTPSSGVTPQTTPWTNPPSSNPLPLPVPGASAYAPSGENAEPANRPPYTLPGANRTRPSSEPVLIEQSSTEGAQIQPANHAGQPQSAVPRSDSSPSSRQRYTGRTHLPPSEENVDAVAADQPAAMAENSPAQAAVHPALPAGPADPGGNLRIESEPMDHAAAQAQAQFAEQTDSQLTQGSASAIHTLPNAPVTPLAARAPSAEGQYNVAQYTPSAQDAATGAYSAPSQSTAAPEQPKPAAAAPPAATTPKHRRQKAAQNQPTLGNAPVEQNPQQFQAPPQQTPPLEAAPPPQNPAPESGAGLTDQELEERNLPPLRGPWVRTQRGGNPLSPREQAEAQLQAIESGYSGWLGGSTTLNYRSGAPGYDQLGAFEAPFEASTPMGYHGRLTVIAKPVFLDSGQATGLATMSVQESTISGTQLINVPEPIGTLTSPDATPPPQQNAAGLGGEVQLAFPHFAIAGGYTPWGFLVSTPTARFYWKPGNGPITITASRDSQKDSQLSYAGLRDPAGTSLGSEGAIWGGVVANQGGIQFARGDAQSGYYFAVGGQYLKGYNVVTNKRFDGTGGAYWRAFATPEYGTLSIGANFFAMHYANNENAFTFGQGGYFSPQAYFLGNVPFTWNGHYLTHWHYNVMGALGLQAFNQDSAPLWPLDKYLETSQNNPMIPSMTTVAANYDLRGVGAYQIGTHWFAGGFFEANNTRNYSFASVGFSVRYLFREQPSTVSSPTGLFPSDGVRPFTVP